MTASSTTAPRPRQLAGALARSAWRDTVATRVQDGRLRDVEWPYGLRAVVLTGMLAALVAGGLAMSSTLLRRTGELLVAQPGSPSPPRAWVWLLVFLTVILVSLFQSATLRGPWWLRVLGLLTTTGLLATWGLRGTGLDESLVATGVVALTMVALVAFCVVRGFRPFAWWEFPVVLAVVGLVVIRGVVWSSTNSRFLGFEFTPLLLQQSLTLLGAVALPAALAAGAAVAEVTVAATLVTVRQAQRLPGRAWPYAILGGLVVVRAVQTIRDLVDFEVGPAWPLVYVPALLVSALLVLLLAVLFRLGRSSGRPVTVAELPEELGRLGLPVAVGLAGLLLPVLAFTTVVSVLVTLSPTVFGGLSIEIVGVVAGLGTDIARLVVAAATLALAVRAARTGRMVTAILLGATGVMLLYLSMRFVTGNRWALQPDVDALNLIATVVALVVLATWALRRRLGRQRALAMSGALVLSALLSYRDVVSDPVGALLGYSAVALVLFGIVWGFLTGSSWANEESPRFPRITRVLLVLANTLLIMTVLAYAALVRDPGSGVDLNLFAELGDLVLGTALLAAAFASVLMAAAEDRPLS